MIVMYTDCLVIFSPGPCCLKLTMIIVNEVLSLDCIFFAETLPFFVVKVLGWLVGWLVLGLTAL